MSPARGVLKSTRWNWIPAASALAVVAGVALGAADPPADNATQPLPPIAPPETFREEQREHWAYQPIERPALPDVKDAAWVRNPIDRFIRSGTESMDFAHAPEADRRSLIRRLSFDLTGLPPTADEVEAFVADTRPDAYERLVDRILASSQYGERWAQHWLDLAHYADSNGFELDADRPDAWRYRDWVVKALNDDLPYDEFVRLQIAGDELRPGDLEALIATGFGRCGPREVVSGNIDPEERRQSELTEVTGTVGSVFLGLTVGCARCHDHKFDALPTTDYYRLQSFFAAAQFVERPIAQEAEEKAFAEAKKAADEKIAPLKAEMAKLEAPYRAALRKKKEDGLSAEERRVMAIPKDKRSPVEQRMAEGANKALNVTWEEVAEAVAEAKVDQPERERLKRAIHDIEVTVPPPPARAMALADEAKDAPEVFVHPRGDVKKKGARVAPRPPGIVLAHQASDAFDESAITPTESTTGRRRVLAAWLTREDHPLTARVIVNRLWQHHFGRGLVASSSDFGVRGEAPSHPELLDWLASELMRNEWRLKPIHYLMVTSAAYRQASTLPDAEVAKRQKTDDPDNALLWKSNRRRLEAEGVRDALLTVTGELNPRMGGPGVKPPIEREVEELIFTEAEVVDLWPEDADPAQYDRRSLYLYRKRNVRYPMFDAFDAPDTQTACAVRDASTHALQSLILINGQFVIDRAKVLAGRVFRELPPAGEQDGEVARAARLDRLYRLVLSRPPRPDELALSSTFLDEQAARLRERAAAGQPLARPQGIDGIDPALGAAWVDLSLALVNRNEFLYLP